MILVDSSALYALIHQRDDLHAEAVALFRAHRPRDFVTTLPILTEVCHLLEARAGPGSSTKLVTRMAQGAFPLLEVTPRDLKLAADIDARYDDARFGFVDSLSMALCEQHQIEQVFTFDRRDFLAYRPSFTRALEVLPAR